MGFRVFVVVFLIILFLMICVFVFFCLRCFGCISCLAFRLRTKHCFPCYSSVVAFVVCVLVIFVVLFACYLMKLVCLVCVLTSAKHKTRLFVCVDLVVWFLFVCFFDLLYLCFSSLARKRSRQTHKNRNAEKKQLLLSVSTVVLTNRVPISLGVGFKMQLLLKTLQNSGFLIEQAKMTQHFSKQLSQYLVQGWVNICSKYVAQHNSTKPNFRVNLRQSRWQICSINLILPAETKNIFKKRKKKTKL